MMSIFMAFMNISLTNLATPATLSPVSGRVASHRHIPATALHLDGKVTSAAELQRAAGRIRVAEIQRRRGGHRRSQPTPQELGS